MTRLKLWQAKLKTARVEQHRWVKAHARAIKALTKAHEEINKLEKKIELELAKHQ